LIPSSEKSSLSLKKLFLEENLSNKFKNGHENFSVVRYYKTMEFTDLFFGQFYFQNNVFKLHEVYSKLGIRVYLENKLEVSRHFLFYRFETNQKGYKDSKNIYEN
jgi:hypothetical protein